MSHPKIGESCAEYKERMNRRSAKEQAIVRRAFDRAVEVANNGNYEDLHGRLCAFFGSMTYWAGRPEVGLDILRPQSSSDSGASR